jgi:hypothetical protein
VFSGANLQKFPKLPNFLLKKIKSFEVGKRKGGWSNPLSQNTK